MRAHVLRGGFYAPFRRPRSERSRRERRSLPDTDELPRQRSDLSACARSLCAFVMLPRLGPGGGYERARKDSQYLECASRRKSCSPEAEHAQLTQELKQAREQQAVASEPLKLISRSAFDLQNILDAVIHAACRLCDADHGAITWRVGAVYYRAALSFSSGGRSDCCIGGRKAA